MKTDLTLSDFDYELPNNLIAKYPVLRRDSSRMLVIDKKTGQIEHKHFFDIINYLEPSDILVLNNTKVIPARLTGKKSTGAGIEIFLTRFLGHNKWCSLIKNAKRLKENDIVKITDDLSVFIVKKGNAKEFGEGNIPENIVELIYEDNSMENILEKNGKIPLPPYIGREAEEKDKETYQTVYAKTLGSVAAPTAGLHFTEEILEKIKNKGVKIACITLNVGLGTFLPVKTSNIKDHKMHTESYFIPKVTADIVNNKKGNIIAIGTTTTRCLEANYLKNGKIVEGCDETDIFIYPPFKFNVVDKLLTNFHLPKSTLLMLISAFSSREIILESYKRAIDQKYRFFSYGDCTFLK